MAYQKRKVMLEINKAIGMQIYFSYLCHVQYLVHTYGGNFLGGKGAFCPS